MSTVAQLDLEPGKDPNVLNITFYDQDHTLGNSLRYMIMKNQNTSFCGYTVPHPLENKMKMRIQTHNDKPIETVNESLDNLLRVAEIIMKKFDISLSQ